MLRVKFERYWNDYHRKDEVKTFSEFAEFEEWMFNQMQQDYTGDKGTMCFPTPNKATRINAKGPWGIELRPKWGGEEIWIHQIETASGIVFSDGKFTAGRKHWSAEVKAWLAHCEERRCNPQFNFVGGDEPVDNIRATLISVIEDALDDGFNNHTPLTSEYLADRLLANDKIRIMEVHTK